MGRGVPGFKRFPFMAIGVTINGNWVGRGRAFVNFDVDANPKISISTLAASLKMPWPFGQSVHFQGKIGKIFFAGAPPPHPRPLAGAGWGGRPKMLI